MIPSPPAVDAVLFSSSPRRLVAAWLAGGVVVWLALGAVYLVLTAALGTPVERTVAWWVAPETVVFGFVALALPMGLWLASPHWLRVSAAGVELRTSLARPVLVPWDSVEFATVRQRGYLAVLVVVPRDDARCSVHDSKGRLPMAIKVRGRTGYPVSAGLFPGGVAAAVDALRLHGVDVRLR